MKTERRHELQTNVLADWIGHKTEAIRPYSKLIVAGIAAVFVVAVVVTIISNQQFERSSRGWADYFAASAGDSPDRLRTVAEEHAGTLPAVWATQREADLELARGIRALYTSRGESIEALGAAKTLYQQVEAGAAGQPILKQAAQFGTAQAFEAEGDVEKARDYYEKAIASLKDSSVSKEAQARLDRLKDKEEMEFLAWFARQTPQPRAPAGGFPGGTDGGTGGGLDLPRDLSELPGRPELSTPAPFDGPNERAESSLPIDEPAPTPPASEGTAPKTTDPAPTTPEPTTPEPTTPEPSAPEPAKPAPSDTPPAPEAPAPEPKAPAPEPAPAEPVPAEPAPAVEPAKPAATPEPTAAPQPETPAADAPAESPADAADGGASE